MMKRYGILAAMMAALLVLSTGCGGSAGNTSSTDTAAATEEASVSTSQMDSGSAAPAEWYGEQAMTTVPGHKSCPCLSPCRDAGLSALLPAVLEGALSHEKAEG